MRACVRARMCVFDLKCMHTNKPNKQTNEWYSPNTGTRTATKHPKSFQRFVEFHIRTENQHLPFGFLGKSQWIYFIVFCRECVHMRAIKTATPLFKCNKRKSICLSVRFRRHINTCMFGRAK